MTAKQKANQARFKAVVAEAKKLRKKNPSLNQAQAVKQAWAIMYGKKSAGKKVGETHKDTKSHNVNIRVVSGIKKGKKKGYITGWRKGNTALIEEQEGIRQGLKNVRVYRSKKGSIKKPGTFNRFAQVSGSVIKNKENRIFVGYTAQPEIIVGKIGSVTALKQLAPEIKVRINRGKKVLTNQILRTDDSVNVLRKFLTGAKVQTQEYALAMFLNNNNNVLAVYQFGMGGYTATVMDPRLLMAAALKLGAVSIILCHNHPSGRLLPSEADKSITKEIVKVANFHNMRVLDHIILTKDGSFSFADAGLLR